MLQGFIVILLFQLSGELLVDVFHSPIPGPVAGMVLLWIALGIKGSASKPLEEASESLLKHLSLLFVPAGTGLFFLPPHIRQDGTAILAAMVAGTFIAMLLTSWIAQLSYKRGKKSHG